MFARYQKGLSPIGMLIVVCIFVFFVVCALKLTPHYIDFNSIKTVYSDVNAQSGVNTLSANEIYETITKALIINSISGFDVKSNTVISKEAGVTSIGLDYEVREKLFGNISVVLTFQYVPE